MRLYLLYVIVVGLAVSAWRDWFRSLCGLILLTAFIEHEDMPKNILGIQGLNPWNALLVCVLAGWLAARRREGTVWDMPRHTAVLFGLYLAVILLGVTRAMVDMGQLAGYPFRNLISEQLINTIKWTVPGLLVFDGCRSQRRLMICILSLLGLYLLVAIQVARALPLSGLFDSAILQHTRLVLADKGYTACDMAAFLAGASWAMVATLPLCRRLWQRFLSLSCAGLMTYAMALTGGRAGYLAWATIGLSLGLTRWRKLLALAPVIVLVLAGAFPGPRDRLLYGFGEPDSAGGTATNEYEVTSGRNLVWPYVKDRIAQAPCIGYGRLAMERTGLTEVLRRELGEGEAVRHSHNAYLEWLLDNGVVGLIPIGLFFIIILVIAGRLFRDRNPYCATVGGITLALVIAQLAAGIASQHFYPEESTLGMWTAVFLMLRISVERSRVSRGPAPQMPLFAASDVKALPLIGKGIPDAHRPP